MTMAEDVAVADSPPKDTVRNTNNLKLCDKP